MDLREIGWGGVVWIHPAQDRDHWWARECDNETSGSGARKLVIIMKMTSLLIALKTEARNSEMSVKFYQTSRYYNPEVIILLAAVIISNPTVLHLGKWVLRNAM
jgi:hypothetical protein